MLTKAVAVTRVRARLLVAGGLLGAGMLCVATVPQARAQEPGQQAVPERGQGNGDARARFAGMQRVGGEVTAVAGATVTVKAEDGALYQVVTTDNTRLMRGRGDPIKLSDLKVGDGVMAVGNLDAPNKTLHAAMLFATNGEQMREERANLGKTFILGKVTAIDMDNAKMTVERPDGVAQTIGFDETTSFRRGGRGGTETGAAPVAPATGTSATGAEQGESITLADIRVGDNVRGTGSVKNGVFVPKQLMVGAAGQGRGRRGEGQGSTAPATPGTQGPGMN